MTRTILCVALLACATACDSGTKTETKTETKVETKTEVKSDATTPTPVDTKTTTVVAPASTKTTTVVNPAATGKDAKPADKAGPATAVADPAKAGDRVKAADPAPTGDKPAEPATDAGGTIAQKEGWATYQKELNRKVEQVNKACGTNISASYDKSTYTDFDPIKDRTQSACEQSIGTLMAICASEEGKSGAKKLTRAICKFSTSGTGASVAGSTLVIKIDPVKSSITGKDPGSYSWSSAIKEVL